MTFSIGIDLGTTFSCIACTDSEGNAKIIENREGERVTPSVVNFDENGSPMVGTTAKRMSVEQSQNTVQYVKRSMGDRNWSFIADNGKKFTAEEISAIILKRIKEDAESVLGEKIESAVVTVPAYFDDSQRKATRDAGRIAGIDVLKVINEPTAAALAYGCGKGKKRETVAIYDLGGGTFDVTVIRFNGENIDVLATGGDRNLGGFDWDNSLMLFLNEEFKKEHGMDILEADDNGEAYLRERAESAKKSLTQRELTSVNLAFGGKRCKTEVSREMFENMTSTLTGRTMDIMKFVLQEAAGKEGDNCSSFKELSENLALEKILLVGGSTRMPSIAKRLKEETGISPSMELNPDEVVALGAAVQHHLLVREKKGGDERDASGIPFVKVRDVNSHGLGIIAVRGTDGNEEYNAVVMPKNTPIPSKVGRTFRTVCDNQNTLDVQVTEGDDEEKNMVKIIGSGRMPLSPHPKGSPLDVFFEYDESGIIHVSVTDLADGEHLGEITINRSSNLADDEIAGMVKNIGSMEVD